MIEIFHYDIANWMDFHVEFFSCSKLPITLRRTWQCCSRDPWTWLLRMRLEFWLPTLTKVRRIQRIMYFRTETWKTWRRLIFMVKRWTRVMVSILVPMFWQRKGICRKSIYSFVGCTVRSKIRKWVNFLVISASIVLQAVWIIWIHFIVAFWIVKYEHSSSDSSNSVLNPYVLSF